MIQAGRRGQVGIGKGVIELLRRVIAEKMPEHSNAVNMAISETVSVVKQYTADKITMLPGLLIN